MHDEKSSSSSRDEKLDKKKEAIYIVDTNVIINDPKFVKKLKGKILITTTVLQELDKHKYGSSEKARNTRDFARYLDKNKDLVWFHQSDSYEGSNDEKIIKTAKILESKGNNVILVTNDILMGLMARALKLKVKKHDLARHNQFELYQGFLDMRHLKDGFETLSEYKPRNPNQYILDKEGLYRWLPEGGLKRLSPDRKIWGISHRNVEQKCALDALLNDDIKLVTLSGHAGTGKTLIALAAGLEKVITETKYDKLIVSRPVIPMGQDIGYLPGDLEEKLNPWMQPIFDNIDFLFVTNKKKRGEGWIKLKDEGLLKLEALTYIRGRSIPNQFIIIDEAQNLTKHEIKTIISRAGENTKVVLTGDIHQIDNPKLDSYNNGLTYAIEKFKNQKISAHVNLTKCERSELAEIASDIL